MANEIDEFTVEVALHSNLKKFVSDKLVVYNENALVVMRRILDKHPDGCFDMIFADPPYHNPQFSTVSRLMGLLKPGGCMILSHPGIGEVPVQNGIVVVDNRSYGEAHLTKFLR